MTGQSGKQEPKMLCCLQQINFTLKDTLTMKILQAIDNQKEVGVAILVSDKNGQRTKSLYNEKEGQSIKKIRQL